MTRMLNWHWYHCAGLSLLSSGLDLTAEEPDEDRSSEFAIHDVGVHVTAFGVQETTDDPKNPFRCQSGRRSFDAAPSRNLATWEPSRGCPGNFPALTF